MRGAVLPRRLDRSGVLAGVLAGVLEHATPTEGEVWHTQQRGCGTPLVHVSPSLFGLFVVERRTQTAPAVRETTGATPRFGPLARHGAAGGVACRVAPGVAHPSRRWGGRSRLYVSLQEGSPARTRAGR